MSSWDSNEFWLKAKMFADTANEHDQASSEFAFWTSLSLECLARSALTFVHPALNADPRDPDNLLYAFGYQITASPRSLPAHSVYLRLEKILTDFGKPQRELCEFVALHTLAHGRFALRELAACQMAAEILRDSQAHLRQCDLLNN
jgi:hypothetical protein